MMLTEKGLKLSKSELKTLLAFAATDSASAYYGVHFKATLPRESGDAVVKARATDGTVAVDAFGHSELDHDAEWFVSRAFLVGVAKLADAEHHVVLKFSGASLHNAAVEAAGGIEVATFSWPGAGAAHSQVSFADAPEWDKRLQLPTRSRGVKCIELRTSSLKLISRLGDAAGVEQVDCYPPPPGGGHTLVRVEGADTVWVAVIDPSPARDDAANKEGD